MDICEGWYAAIASSEVVQQTPRPLRRFGTDLVAWRDSQGQPVVMRDLCPHRSVKLSLGKVHGDRIICPFHGFEFGGDGSCTLVPETGKAAPNLRCATFPAREKHGFIWLWHGAATELPPEIPWFDELTDDFACHQIQMQWPSHITRCIENQLDYAHLPYVHKTSIGANFDVAKAHPKFQLSDRAIKLPLESGFFEFKFPNIWQLQIVPGKFYQFIAFVPVDDTSTVMYLRSYQKFVTLPILRELMGLFMNFQSKMIIQQDQRVVVSHPVSPSPSATNEKLYPSDNGIAHFRKHWPKSAQSVRK